MITFGRALQLLRETAGLTPYDLADALGVPEGVVRWVESEVRAPRVVLEQAASILGSPIEPLEALLTEEGRAVAAALGPQALKRIEEILDENES